MWVLGEVLGVARADARVSREREDAARRPGRQIDGAVVFVGLGRERQEAVEVVAASELRDVLRLHHNEAVVATLHDGIPAALGPASLLRWAVEYGQALLLSIAEEVELREEPRWDVCAPRAVHASAV